MPIKRLLRADMPQNRISVPTDTAAQTVPVVRIACVCLYATNYYSRKISKG